MDPEPAVKINVCAPSPCGPNSQCRNVNDHAVCSCLPDYIGAPPNCRPECVVSSECELTKACNNKKCINPCIGACGPGARCEVINHSPICSCPAGQTGDPFQGCRDLPPPSPEPPVIRDPCNPSPCGPNANCRAIADSPSCSCIENYIGSPPNCRPECTINADCPTQQACINNKCKDPCPGSCGSGAECHVISHAVSCICPTGYEGNPFVQCVLIRHEPMKACEPNPCGPNAICREQNGAGSCRCIDEYLGDPYEGCRPECVLSSDCPSNKACVRNKCQDPCPGVCGVNAQCTAFNHVPQCTCLPGFTGDPFQQCVVRDEPVTEPTIVNPCVPSPCGPNSRCREANGVAVCSCDTEFIGTPPNCRPECTVNAECPSDKACHRFKCTDPCKGTCGLQANCQVNNHNPICSCPNGFEGDPFVRCTPIPPKPIEPKRPENPCVPSPCGLYADCRAVGETPSCSCQPNYIGLPPNCRPECVVDTDCPQTKACQEQKCRDPCVSACGFNARCNVQNHRPICFCDEGFEGDPYSGCQEIRRDEPPLNACEPSPCGTNAECIQRNGAGACKCLPEYFGDPYTGCRPECVLSQDCPTNKACKNNKCVDPCPGVCGANAQCSVIHHAPQCNCLPGFQGDPFRACTEVRQERKLLIFFSSFLCLK